MHAAEVRVHFDQPDNGNFLRLNMASNGWTRVNLSQYYDDLAVRYRRMDHWNNHFGPIRRRPDGGLYYDYWSLDHAIYEGTGGFHIKAYPTVDYSPACFTTDFLRNPIMFDRETYDAQLTPAGTLIVSGKNPWPKQTAAAGMFEINRKGIILWQTDYHASFAVTPTNWLIIHQDDGTYLVLDAGAKRSAAARVGSSRKWAAKACSCGRTIWLSWWTSKEQFSSSGRPKSRISPRPGPKTAWSKSPSIRCSCTLLTARKHSSNPR